MALPKGRMTIRKTGAVSTDPMTPQTGRDNRRVRLWELDAKPGTTIARLEVAYLAALDAVDKIAEHKASAIKSGKFTSDGVNADTLNFALSNSVPTFKQGRRAIATAKQEVAALREKTKLAPIDKTDVVGFMQRQEIRTWLRSMSDDQRGKYLSANVDRLDPTIALAVLEAPAELSGAPESVRSHIQDRALEAQHGNAVAELLELERAIEVAESAVEAGRDEIRIEVGVTDPREFDRIAAPVEAKHSAPWLRRRGDVVHLVDLDKRVERLATEDELAVGIFADTHDQYLKEQAA